MASDYWDNIMQDYPGFPSPLELRSTFRKHSIYLTPPAVTKLWAASQQRVREVSLPVCAPPELVCSISNKTTFLWAINKKCFVWRKEADFEPSSRFCLFANGPLNRRVGVFLQGEIRLIRKVLRVEALLRRKGRTLKMTKPHNSLHKLWDRHVQE